MPRSVLVVDDDPLVLDVTAMMLDDLGCETITACSGGEALKKLQQRRDIEILITDINMAGIDGYELADQARRLRLGLQVILLSGREVDTHGFPFIRKPFIQRDLARVIEDTVGRA